MTQSGHQDEQLYMSSHIHLTTCNADFPATFFHTRLANVLEGEMADIIPFPRRLKVFDTDLTTAMGDAYDKAMSTLDDGRSELVIRELIAKRIVRMAQSGEVDAEFLCTSALSGFRKTAR